MSVYIEELAYALNNHGKDLSITVPARTSDDDSAHWAAANAYDWGRIGQLMTNYPNLYVRVMAFRGELDDGDTALSTKGWICHHNLKSIACVGDKTISTLDRHILSTNTVQK